MVLACLNAPDTCVRLVIAADSFKPVSDLAAMTSRIVTIRIPALATREAELDPLLEAYGLDAAEEFGVGHIGFRPQDFGAHPCPQTSRPLEEIEDITPTLGSAASLGRLWRREAARDYPRSAIALGPAASPADVVIARSTIVALWSRRASRLVRECASPRASRIVGDLAIAVTRGGERAS